MPIPNITNGESGSSARTSINQAIDAVNGLGDSATKNVGSSIGTVCAGDDPRLSDARAPTAHASTHTNGTDDIQDATALQKGLATSTQITKLDGIEAGADVTDAVNVGSTIGGATAITTIGDTDQIPVVQTTALKSITYGALKTLLGAIYQAKATILGTLGGLADSAGYLKNDGAGVLSWATPSGGGGGKVAQVIYTASSTPASGTLTFPADNTIPQNTEGAALSALDTTITPTNAGSQLLIRVFISCGNSAGTTMAVALFRDSDSNAIQAQHNVPAINAPTSLAFEAVVPANATTATTFKVRYGGLAACTMYINTFGGTQYLGGAVKSTVTVEEILP